MADTLRAENRFPSRVVDLGAVDSARWQLLSHNLEVLNSPKYTTMTYRWGDVPFLKLTSATLPTFKAGMSISDLPQVFQDAISVTKEMGIRFIWIDALCIIQDNPDDFSHECAEMSNIYANSTCNFIASLGKDPYASLFSHRNFERLQIGRFDRACPTTRSASNLWQDVDSVVEQGFMSEPFRDRKITTRGWILQEFLLAPRALCFDRDQVHWLCSTEASELWPKENPDLISTRLKTPPLFDDDGAATVGSWHRLVQRYSALDLTVAQDRLVAISGLAKRYQEKLVSEYFAGHWGCNLIQSLHWRRRVEESNFSTWDDWKRRSITYIAPSWSWASVNGPVNMPLAWGGLGIVLCEINDVRVSTAGDDPIGQATGGHLILQAPSVHEKIISETAAQKAWGTGYYTKWDHGRPPCGTLVDIIATRTYFHPTRYGPINHETGRDCTVNGLVLLVNDAKTGSHIRIGTITRNVYVKQGVVPPELLAFGIGISTSISGRKHDGDVFIEDRTKFKTFKIV